MRETIGQPHLVRFSEGIPNRRFQPSPRMMIAAEALYQRREFARIADGRANHRRRHELRQHVSSRFGGLMSIAGPKLNRAFTPTDDAGIGLQLHQHRYLVRLSAEAGLEWREIRQENGMEIN